MVLQDLEAVRFAAHLPRADTLKDPLVVYLQQPPSLSGFHELPDCKAEEDFINNIRRYLSQQTAVVVRGWFPQNQMKFSAEDFLRAGRYLTQKIQYQGFVLVPNVSARP
jgi:hypothetical protein